MSNLTQEAILAELAKLSDSKGRVVSFYDGQTIVPNSLLEQVWLEAERKTEERIIKLLEQHLIWSYDIGLGYKLGSQIDLDDLFELIRHKGENK